MTQSFVCAYVKKYTIMERIFVEKCNDCSIIKNNISRICENVF